jgi:hypothetical protein
MIPVQPQPLGQRLSRSERQIQELSKAIPEASERRQAADQEPLVWRSVSFSFQLERMRLKRLKKPMLRIYRHGSALRD